MLLYGRHSLLRPPIGLPAPRAPATGRSFLPLLGIGQRFDMSDLSTLIAEHHSELHQQPTIDSSAALHALADVESDHGARSLASKHESAYCYNGFYYSSPNGD